MPRVNEPEITITLREYNYLLLSGSVLETLRAFGVHEWEHYNKAILSFHNFDKVA